LKKFKHNKYSIHALHKTASMFLKRFFEDLSKIKNFKLYTQDEVEREHLFLKETKKCILCPERTFPTEFKKDIFYILLLRNPLDILVSKYYSFGWIHPSNAKNHHNKRIHINFTKQREEIQKLSIDEYCLNAADELYDKLTPLLENTLDGNNYILIKYDTLVLDFKKWCLTITDIFDATPDEHDILYSKFKREFENIKELTPNEIFQGKKRHKRKVIPGDHLDKLKKETIIKLNKKFKPFLDVFNKL